MPTDRQANSNTSPISALHAAYLEARAVALAVAVAAGLMSISKDEVATRLGRDSAPCGGLYIPYKDSAGTVYYQRVRLLDPATPEGCPRFLVPEGRVRPYIPPTVEPSVSTGSEPIYFVEGAIKALSLSAAGLPAIGLGGANAGGHDAARWQESKELLLHPDLVQRLNLQERPVVIVFDAGRARNPAVANGEAMLSLALRRAGAVVRAVALPFAEGGADQGPDDFIHQHGHDALIHLIHEAKPADPVQRARDAGALEGQARTDALAALLTDLPWLAAMALSGGAVVDVSATEFSKGDISKSALKGALKDFRRGLAGHTKREGRERYRIVDGRTCEVAVTRDGGHDLRELANFVGVIIEEVTRDDGLDLEKVFKVQLTLPSGLTPPTKYVKASEFFEMRWPLDVGGVAAVTAAGRDTKDKLREAIQLASSHAVKRTVFSHTGWRLLDGAWRFLHAAGAVGGGNYEVALGPPFDRLKFPDNIVDAREAMQWSLRFLRCGPMKMIGPILGGRLPGAAIVHPRARLRPRSPRAERRMEVEHRRSGPESLRAV